MAASIVQEMRFVVDVSAGVIVQPQRAVLVKGDANANCIIVAVVDGKEPVDLTGVTVTGSFYRPPDGAEVPLTGEASRNEASVLLSEHCYATDGYYEARVKLTSGSTTRTILFITGNIQRGGSGAVVDVDDVIPSLDELLAQIQATKDAAAAANAAADGANAAAGAANTAADRADESADAADKATAGAQGWVNATATVEMLNADAAPVVTITDQDTGKQLHFALPRGLTGLTPQLQIGTITTLEEGQQATATITGTAEAPVLNLAIPRGATGNVDGLTYFDTTPAGLGAASPGTSGAVARGDHVHPMPSAADVKALPDTGQALHTFKDTTSENADFWGLEQKVTGIAGEYGALGIRFFPGEAVRIARGIDGAYQSYRLYDKANKPTADDVGALAKEATAADSAKLGGVAAGQYALKNDIPAAYTLPAATASTLGGVKAGGGMSVASDGTLSGMQFVQILPIATYSKGATLAFSDSPYKYTHFFATLNYCGTGFARMSGSTGQRGIAFYSLTCGETSMTIRVMQMHETSAMNNNWTLTYIQQYYISTEGEVDITQPTSTQLGVYGIKAY